MKIIRIISLATVITVILAIPASYSYSTYAPLWSERLNATTGSSSYPLDILHSVTFSSNYAFFIGTFTGEDSSGNASINTSLIAVTYEGNVVRNYIYYYSNGNLTSLDSLYAWGNIYITGYLSDSYGVNGIIYAVNASNGSVENYYVDTDTRFTVMRGVCRDGLGHVFSVGLQYSPNGSPKINATVYEFDNNLNLIVRNEFYVSGYNMTAWDCIVGPGGALYVSTTLYYYSNGYNYPVYFVLLKLDQNLNIINYSLYPLYNSQYYVTLSSNHWIPLSTDNNLVYAAYTWTDDKPSPTQPSTRASVIAVNTSLSVVWNYTLSTNAYEFFDSLSVGSDGSLIVAGATNNNYTTPLSTAYYHGLALVFDASHSLQRAVLFGGSNGEIVLAAGIDYLGGTYLASYSRSDNVSFYDVTKEVLLAKLNPGPIGLASKNIAPNGFVRLPKGVLASIHVYSNSERAVKPLRDNRIVIRLVDRSSIVPLVTVSGLSSGLAVKLSDTLSPPPQPVPESVLVPVAIIASIIALVLLMRKTGAYSI